MESFRKALFEAMRNNLEVMAEYADNETALLNELQTADNDIINEYRAIWEV